MISAVSKNGAAISAKRIISTAEMAKLAATTQFGPSARTHAELSRSSSVRPVVPTTAWMPCIASHGTVVRAAVGDGEVDDDLGAGVGERPGLGGDRDALDDPAGGARIDGCDELELGVGSTAAHTVRPSVPRRR